ncbi:MULTISPECIES: hypothetical protein [Bacillaceae]|uniref:DUF5673 domain-containing protein n=1 Tax=Evansella alkalicola TaxID=745819 RepID=A0ABS6JTH0_9BACI|nr:MULTISPECIES: hypothetical protein [Bacillaceae]MBU9721862.1 hypothetical protein [Bacillus alkalicola]
MHWLYLFTSTILGVIAIYHLFAHKRRETMQDYVIYELKDKRKLGTSSKTYKFSIWSSYIVLILNLFIIIELFRSFQTATILFLIILPLGLFVLITLDRVFEVRGNALIFAGYHTQWGKIRSIKWGKQRAHRTKLIMELDKGTKINTTIANEEKEELESLLSNYVYFEKEKK